MVDAAIEGPDALSRALGGYEVADEWEVFPGAVQATRDARAENPAGARWGARLFLLEEPRTLVGWGGFKGPPSDGTVELGYAVAPEFRERGIASEAVRQMLEDAFSDAQVERVIAHTLRESNPSTRVLERAGFALEGDFLEGEDEVWRWSRPRPGA